MNKKIRCAMYVIGTLMVFSLHAEVKLETLMKSQLESVNETEVIMSKVVIPPNTSLPKHWHPGEEFAYILSGEVTLWQKDQADILLKAGEAKKIPLKQIHTAITGEQGVTLLVFRVHQQGKPERVLVE